MMPSLTTKEIEVLKQAAAIARDEFLALAVLPGSRVGTGRNTPMARSTAAITDIVEAIGELAKERDRWRGIVEKGRLAGGWKLVPIEPTEAMQDAGNAVGNGSGERTSPADIYQAMIAAAPVPSPSDSL